MKFAVVRLLVAGLLFFGWIGWLVYLATTQSQPVVLSRPQLLVSDVDVIAQVEENPDGPGDRGPSPTVKVVEVAWASDGKDIELKTITVANLASFFPEESSDKVTLINGWEGPGLYILPLKKELKDGTAEYKVAGIPRSPGYPHGKAAFKWGHPRIYRATDDARRQLKNIRNGDWN